MVLFCLSELYLERNLAIRRLLLDWQANLFFKLFMRSGKALQVIIGYYGLRCASNNLKNSGFTW